MENLRLRFSEKIIVIILLITALIPYFLLSYYCNPSADDFSFAIKAREGDLLQQLKSEYSSWNGRYFSNVLVLLSPLSFSSLSVYKILPVILILLTICSNYFLLLQLAGKIFSKLKIFAAAVILSLLFIYQVPDLAEGIYWYTGAVTYHAGNILTLLYAGLIIKWFRTNAPFRKKIYFILLIIPACIIPGMNEVIMLFLIGFQLLIVIISFKNHLQWKPMLLLFVLIIAASSFVIFSPGNAGRSMQFDGDHRLLYSVAFSLLQFIRFFCEWISSLPLFIASFFYILIHEELKNKSILFKNSFYLSPYTTLALMPIVIFICVFPPYWSTGLLGQHRTVNVAYFLFVFVWFINLCAWMNKIERVELKMRMQIKKSLFLLMMISFIATKNGYTSVMDLLKGKAAEYDRQMSERFEQMKNADESQTGIIYFPPLTKPVSLFVLDITDDTASWLNMGYTEYFRSNRKVSIEECPALQH
jgi:hypothetical protein